MTTELQFPTKFDVIRPSDGFAMAAARVEQTVVGIAKIDGQSRFVARVENHPGFRAPQPNDAYQMNAEKVGHIKGVIETREGVYLVKPENMVYAI